MVSIRQVTSLQMTFPFRGRVFDWMDKFRRFGLRTQIAINTQSQYENSVNAIKKTDMLHGTYIDLIFQNEVEFLDLTEHRFEVKSRPSLFV
jgi:S-adenosylmethionine:diacylglycerol 3-amino-3-carboxypropyl transferase